MTLHVQFFLRGSLQSRRDFVVVPRRFTVVQKSLPFLSRYPLFPTHDGGTWDVKGRISWRDGSLPRLVRLGLQGRTNVTPGYTREPGSTQEVLSGLNTR